MNLMYVSARELQIGDEIYCGQHVFHPDTPTFIKVNDLKIDGNQVIVYRTAYEWGRLKCAATTRFAIRPRVHIREQEKR